MRLLRGFSALLILLEGTYYSYGRYVVFKAHRTIFNDTLVLFSDDASLEKIPEDICWVHRKHSSYALMQFFIGLKEIPDSRFQCTDFFEAITTRQLTRAPSHKKSFSL